MPSVSCQHFFIDSPLDLFDLQKDLQTYQQSLADFRLLLLSLDPKPIRGSTSGVISNRDLPKNQFKLLLRQVRLPIPWGSLAIRKIID